MSKISNKDKILANGLQVVLERGYVGASVRDIVEAAGVPQGSFTNHFASKEAFSLEILDRYFANSRAVMAETLRNEALAPLKRLRAYIDASIGAIRNHGTKKVCMVANFAAEASDHSEIIRKLDSVIYSEERAAMTGLLEGGRERRRASQEFQNRRSCLFHSYGTTRCVAGFQG